MEVDIRKGAAGEVPSLFEGIAPRLGENTDEILSEIGYADTEIARLHDDRIVAGPS